MNAPPRPALRVVVLATTLPAVPGDGTPEFVLDLARGLVSQGLKVTVVAPRVPGSVGSQHIDGVNVRRFRYFPAPWEDLAAGAIVPNLSARPSRWLQVLPLLVAMWLAGRRQVRISRADVVHAHWIIPGGLVARFLGRPYVVTAHGADAYALNGRLGRWAKRVALGRSVAVIPVSAAIGDRIGQLGIKAAAPVAMGVHMAALAEVVGVRTPRQGRILFVGRLAEKKGVGDLLTALGSISDCHLHIVGDGPDRSLLEARATALGVAGQVTFLGQLPREGVFAEMREAQVIALPSRSGRDGDEDGVPVVLAEAMAAGLPVVATSAGGLGEHVVHGHTGWLVPPGEADALAASLIEALSDSSEANRRAGLARAWGARHLDLQVVSAAYSEILRSAGQR